jgi:TPR repeat protein
MHRNQQVMARRKCSKCGREISGAKSTCPKCGTPSAAAATAGRSSILVIGIMALCLGVLVYFVAPLFIQQEAVTVPEAAPPPDVEGIKTRAEKGEAAAQSELATLFTQGDGVKRDYQEAAKWYQLAADQGLAKAQVALGELYEAGQGVPRDDAEAAKWYRKAADQGFAAGQYALAVLYLVGRGVPKDDAEALKLYRQSADQNYALALFHLGMRYKKGQGVPVDPVEAYKWLTLAAAGGIAEASEIRDEVKSSMTREQIAEGKQRAEAFSSKQAGSQGK